MIMMALEVRGDRANSARVPSDRDGTVALIEMERLLHSRPRGWSTSELARELACSTRTVQRDLAVQESELNTPLVEDGHRYRLMEGAPALAPLRFTLQEARAILLAARLYFKNTLQPDPDGASALEKVGEVLPPSAAAAVRLTTEELKLRTGPSLYTAVVRTITDAWATSTNVVIQYRSHDDMSYRTTTLSPYLIEPGGRGATYVIGASSRHPQNLVRTFKLDRIRAATLTKEHFKVSSETLRDLVGKLTDSWSVVFTDDIHEVVVDFTPEVADRVGETVWHPSQELQPLPGGGVRMRVRLPHLMEFVPWVRTWGADALVVSPPELRKELAESLAAAAARYA